VAFVAPMAGRVAAGAATRSAGAGAAAKAGAKSAGKAAAGKAATAPARARQLVAAGKSRADASRIIRDEYGSTLAEADGLVGAASSTGEAGGAGASATPPASPATPARAQVRRRLPGAKAVGQTVEAGGGILLGSIGYVLLMAYLRDGSAGVKRWLKAKFLNQVEAR